MSEIEQKAFEAFYPPDYLHDGVNTMDDLERVRGVMRQRDMLREYARRKASGEFPDGPAIR